MGFHAISHDQFSTSEPVNKAVLGLSIIRLFLFFCIFVVNLNQSIQIFVYARKKKKYLNPRLFTFVSITIYPFTRLFMIGVFFYDKSIDNGSITACISIWGTLFQYCEWTYIAVFWASLLFTYFIKEEIILKNTKRVWIGAFILTFLVTVWTIIQTIFNFYYVDIMNATYGPGQVVIVAGIGSFYFVNGWILARQMKKNGNCDRIPMLEETFKRVIKMSIALLILIVGIFVVYIIKSLILHVKPYETENYAFYIVLCLLEFTQLSIVMYSLGGDSYRNYLSFGHSKGVNSSKNFTEQSANSSNVNNSSITEINLNEIAEKKSKNNNSSKSSLSPSQSNTSLSISQSNVSLINNSNQNFNISISIDNDDNKEKIYLEV